MSFLVFALIVVAAVVVIVVLLNFIVRRWLR
jgi:hypothetical protein